MGLFNFFSSRRERESAIPPSEAEAIIGKLEEDDRPVGQPIQNAGVPQAMGPFGVGEAVDIGTVFGVLGMVKQAVQSGNVQISHGDDHVIDMRGTADGQALREQLMAAMQQAGIDPEAIPEGGQVDAAQYGDLQQKIADVLAQHGVDTSAGASFEVLPDLDGDGKPG